MSKGSSHLFTNTSGEGKTLIAEVQANGDKISPEKVVLITRDPNGMKPEQKNPDYSTLLKNMVLSSTEKGSKMRIFRIMFSKPFIRDMS